MKWNADQRAGGFGWTPEGQLLHREVVDLDEALAETAYDTQLFFMQENHPTVPLFSGGLMDAWPSRAVDALAIARTEMQNIRAYRERGAPRG